jgi:hypothetical protein
MSNFSQAGQVFSQGQVATLRQVEGFKFRDGWMLKWGARKADLVDHFENHPMVGEVIPNELRSRENSAVVCTNGLQTTDREGRGFQKLLAGFADPNGVFKASGGEGCVVGRAAMPEPYTVFHAFFWFVNDRFYRVSGTFLSKNFTDATRSVIATFGKPTVHDVGTVKNRLGADFDQEEMGWVDDGDEITILYQKRAGDVETGHFSITSNKLEGEVQLPAPKPPPF